MQILVELSSDVDTVNEGSVIVRLNYSTYTRVAGI